MLVASIDLVENAIILITEESFRVWRWYSGVYQQYHSAFNLLIELFHNPTSPHAKRLWAALSFVFNFNLAEVHDGKAFELLMEIKNKSSLYQRLRGHQISGPSFVSICNFTVNESTPGSVTVLHDQHGSLDIEACPIPVVEAPFLNGWDSTLHNKQILRTSVAMNSPSPQLMGADEDMFNLEWASSHRYVAFRKLTYV